MPHCAIGARLDARCVLIGLLLIHQVGAPRRQPRAEVLVQQLACPRELSHLLLRRARSHFKHPSCLPQPNSAGQQLEQSVVTRPLKNSSGFQSRAYRAVRHPKASPNQWIRLRFRAPICIERHEPANRTVLQRPVTVRAPISVVVSKRLAGERLAALETTKAPLGLLPTPGTKVAPSNDPVGRRFDVDRAISVRATRRTE